MKKIVKLIDVLSIVFVVSLTGAVISCSDGGGSALIKSGDKSKMVVTFDMNGKKENAYTVWISTNVYYIKNYHFNIGWDMVIPEAYIILGETIKGPISATLIPVKPLFVSYQNFTNQEVEYIYIRNFPEWFETNIIKNAALAKLDSDKHNSIIKVGVKASQENFKGNMHYNDYAIIQYDASVSKVKLLYSNIVLDWSTWSKKIEVWNLAPGDKNVKKDATVEKGNPVKVYQK